MISVQCGLDGDVEDRGEDDGDHTVEDGGGELSPQGYHGRLVGQAVDPDALEIGLQQIQQGIGHRAGGGRPVCRAHAVGGGLFAAVGLQHVPKQQPGHQAVGPLGQECDPALRNVQRIQAVINGGADTGGKSAVPGAQQKPGQGTEDVAQVERGGACNVDGHGHPNGGADHCKRGQQRGDNDFLGGDICCFHGDSSQLSLFAPIISLPGYK